MQKGRVGDEVQRSLLSSPITRREWLVGSVALIGGLAWPYRGALAEPPYVLPEATEKALRESPLIYVSPLRSDGQESRCHGEVWFFEDAGDPVIFTARDRWKATAIRDGLNRARVWVGDAGRVRWSGDRFRKEPTFLAAASIDQRPEVFEKLMTRYAKRYADEWGKWGPRFQKGWDDGTRVMIRHTPIGA